jgi:hypothetical protein
VVSHSVPGSGEKRLSVVRRFTQWANSQQSDQWIELLAVLMLTTASLAAAWSGYQASRWGGNQATLYSQASSKRTEATDASTRANLYTLIDMEVFNDYADAYTDDDPALMAFIERQFSDRLRPAVDAWLETDPLNNSDAPSHPLAMPEYVVPELKRSETLQQEAELLFEEGIHANQQSDEFVLNTVYLATVLFFAGIATKIEGRPARIAIVVLGISLLFFGVYHLVTLQVG